MRYLLACLLIPLALAVAACGPATAQHKSGPARVAIHTPSPTPEPQPTITNGVRYTVTGQRIDAHDGQVAEFGGVYYWYGTTYSCGFVYGKPSPFCGFVVYTSNDLTNWFGPYPLFDASTAYWQQLCMNSPGAANNGCFRPHVIFDPNTALYVLWVNVPDGDGFRALTSPTPMGPFTLAGTPVLSDSSVMGYDGKPGGNGDLGLYEDGLSGYVTYNRGGTLVVEQLSADDLTGAGQPQAIRDYPEVAPWFGVEAPSLFERDGDWYITVSLPRCPYCTAATGLMRAPTPNGPWSYAGELSANSCQAQPDAVTQLEDGTYLYQSDQWLQGPTWPNSNETDANQYWQPLTFNLDGSIQPLTCGSSFPLGG